MICLVIPIADFEDLAAIGCLQESGFIWAQKE
jgi:hypothetical protein